MTAINGHLNKAAVQMLQAILMVRVMPGVMGPQISEEYFKVPQLIRANTVSNQGRLERLEERAGVQFDESILSYIVRPGGLRKVKKRTRAAAADDPEEEEEEEDFDEDDVSVHLGAVVAAPVGGAAAPAGIDTSQYRFRDGDCPTLIPGERRTATGLPTRLTAASIRGLKVQLTTFGIMQAFTLFYIEAVDNKNVVDPEQSNLERTMNTELLKFPPICTEFAERKIKALADQIDLETNVWLCVKELTGPIILTALSDFWWPAHMATIFGIPPGCTRVTLAVDPEWSNKLMARWDLPLQDPDPQVAEALRTPLDWTAVEDMTADWKLKVRLLLHMLQYAVTRFRANSNFYTAVEYVKAKKEARAEISKDQWTAMGIPYQYAIRKELRYLVSAIEMSAAMMEAGGDDGAKHEFLSMPDVADSLGDEPVVALAKFSPTAHDKVDPYRPLELDGLARVAYLSLNSRVDRLKKAHPDHCQGGGWPWRRR